MTGPVINFNDLNVPVDRTPMTRDFFNTRFQNIAGAINGIAGRMDAYDLVVSSLVQLGMDRVNMVLGPLLSDLQEAAISGFLTAVADGIAVSLTVGVDVQFTLTSGGLSIFTPTPYMLALDETDSTNWGIISLNAYDNTTGILAGHCIYSNNGPQASTQWSISAQSAVIAAQMNMVTQTLAARTDVLAAAATVTVDYAAIESAIAAIETGPVISVAGKVGAVTLVAADVSGAATSSSVTSAITAAIAALGLNSASTHAVTDFLLKSNNLSDIAVAATARTNLGLGTAATHVATDFLQTSNNLSDVVAATARTNLVTAGGAAVTSQSGTLTLTQASLRSQNVAFTVTAQSVVLPDATTYATGALGGPIFSIYNNGDFTFAIRRSDLTILCVIAAGGSSDLYLDGNGTAAGPWRAVTRAAGPEVHGGLFCLDTQMSSTYTLVPSNSYQFVSLSNTLALAFLWSTGGTYVVAIDASTYPSTIGTPVLIDSTRPSVWTVATSATTAQIAWRSTSVLFKTAVVSVSGTTVTIGTPTTSAITTSSSFFSIPGAAPQVGVAGQYAAICFQASSNALQVLPIYWNGTTSYVGSIVTFAATTTSTNAVIACFPIDATHVLIIYEDDSGTAGTPFSIRAAVATLSGTTTPSVAIGTSAGISDITSDALASAFATCQLSSTLYVLGYHDTVAGNLKLVSISISGTAVTFGTPVVLEATASLGFPSYRGTSFSFPSIGKLTATTALVNWVIASPGVVRHAVITNTAGVITVGTVYYGLTPSVGTVTGLTYQLSPTNFVCMYPVNTTASISSGLVTGASISGTSIALTKIVTGLEWSPASGTAAVGLNADFCAMAGGSVLVYRSYQSYQACVIRFKDGVPIPVGRISIPVANSVVYFASLSATKLLMMTLPQNDLFNLDGVDGDTSVRISVLEIPT